MTDKKGLHQIHWLNIANSWSKQKTCSCWKPSKLSTFWNCWWVQAFARFPSLHMKYHEFMVPNNFHVFRGLQSMNLVQAKLGLHTFVTAPICISYIWFVNHFSQLYTLSNPELSFGLGGPVAYMIYTGIQNQDLLQHQQHYRILQAQMQEWLGAAPHVPLSCEPHAKQCKNKS
jgi:hypothetical protein